MKKFLLSAAAAVAATCIVSCNKMLESGTPGHEPQPYGGEIVFAATDSGVIFGTKASEVTSLESFSVAATAMQNGRVSQYWKATASKSGGEYVTGHYWPVSDLGYSFYASNAEVGYADGKATVSIADCDTDIVCAYALNPSYRVSPVNLNFSHILARIGDVSFSVLSGYELAIQGITLEGVYTKGTYDLTAGTWTPSGPTVAKSLQRGSNDVWMVPGSYYLTINYSLTRGDFTESYSSRQMLTFSGGKINRIVGNISKDPATEIIFGVSVSPWESTSGTVTL